MSTNEWWMLALCGSLGAVTGGGLTLVWARARFGARLRNAADELQRHAALVQKSKAALARLQTELDNSRGAMTRQRASRVTEPAVAIAQTEERLKAAYEELDALRRRPAQDSEAAELTDGFAATRPMYDAM
jgi:succinate dehydrogenase/fumarate reductase flavoprotein subunit